MIEESGIRILALSERLLGLEKLRARAVAGIGWRQQVLIDLGEESRVPCGVHGEESLEGCLRRGGAPGILTKDHVVGLEGLGVLAFFPEGVRAEQKDLGFVLGIGGKGGLRDLQHRIIFAGLGRESERSEGGDGLPPPGIFGGDDFLEEFARLLRSAEFGLELGSLHGGLPEGLAVACRREDQVVIPEGFLFVACRKRLRCKMEKRRDPVGVLRLGWSFNVAG